MKILICDVLVVILYTIFLQAGRWHKRVVRYRDKAIMKEFRSGG